MTVNTSSRVTTLTIGSHDWSAWIDPSSGIQIGTPEYECGNGLLITKGTINFLFPASFYGLPSSPLFLLNPTQWKRGQSLSIQVGGNYLNCSGQLLYILAIPEEPRRDISGKATMSLSIGCRLALENFPPEPNRDISGVTVGTPLDRGTVISNILTYLGIPNSIGSIPYPIDYALPKTSGNFLQMAGKIADEAGYHLRCNTTGTVIAAPNDLIYGAIDLSYQIGRDEKSWESIGKISEQPLERTIVTGVVRDITAPNNYSEVIENEALAKTYEIYREPAVGRVFSNNSAVLRKTIKNVETVSPTLAIATTTVSEALAYTYPKIYNGISPSIVFSNALDEVLKETTEYYLQNGLCYKTVFYEYEALAKTYEIYREPAVGRTFSNALAPLRKTVTEWAKIRDGLWDKTTTVSEALAYTYPKIYNGISPSIVFSNALDELSSITEPDTSGPPTNFGDIGNNVTSDRQISVIVNAQQLAEDPYRPRERTINLEFANTQAQLTAYGENFNRFLTGRSQGKQFVGAIPTSSDFVPFKQVAITDPFVGLVYYLKIDSIQYAINLTEAIAAFNGILCATAPTSAPSEVVRPVEITLGDLRFRIDSDCYAVIPDSLGSAPFRIDSDSYAVIPASLSPVSIFLIDSRS